MPIDRQNQFGTYRSPDFSNDPQGPCRPLGRKLTPLKIFVEPKRNLKVANFQNSHRSFMLLPDASLIGK